jgi:hypothetical protein
VKSVLDQHKANPNLPQYTDQGPITDEKFGQGYLIVCQMQQVTRANTRIPATMMLYFSRDIAVFLNVTVSSQEHAKTVEAAKQ